MPGQIVGVEMRVKTIFAGLLFALYSSVSSAQYDANDLDKLFTDKSQRARIDAARSGNSGFETQRVDKVKVSGYMKRSDGKNVVWVNGESTIDKSRLGDIRVHQKSIGKEKKVTISVDGKTVRIKPGEAWLKDTGNVVDSHK